MLFISIYPTLSVLVKLHEIWEDYFRIDLQMIAEGKLSNELHLNKTFKERRFLKMSPDQEEFKLQLYHFPKWLRYTFAAGNFIFILFFSETIKKV